MALAALDAQVHVSGSQGARTIAFHDFHRVPDDRPELDSTLADVLLWPPARNLAAHQAGCRRGRSANVAVNADVPPIDVIFVDVDDRVGSRLVAKGVGEIGLVGVAAAVCNAIFHATGKRVRSLPLTPDKVMAA